MNKIELVAAMAESANLTKAEAGAALDAFLDRVTAELQAGEEVRLVGFGTFTTVNGMSEGRAGAAIAALPSGGALIAGGFQLVLDIPNAQFGFNPTSSADKFAQGPNRITATGSMSASRLFPVAANLPDGTVLVVGGGGPAEIYQNN